MKIFPFIAYQAIVVSFAEVPEAGGENFPFIAYRAIVVSFAEAPGGGR